LRAAGFNYEGLTFMNRTGAELGQYLNGSTSLYNFPALRINRAAVRDTLLRRVRQAGISVYWRKKYVGVVSETSAGGRDNNGSATVQFKDGEAVTAHFVVAADGIHYCIRSFVTGTSAEPTFSGLMGIGGSLHSDQLDPKIASSHELQLPCMMFGAKGTFAIMPSSHDGQTLGFFTTVEVTDRNRDSWTALGKNPEEMVGILRKRFLDGELQWPALVQQLCENKPTASLSCWPFFSVPHLSSWTSSHKRVILIGDAAQAIPPTGGQGAAIAFEDAVVHEM
jgi:2-polyprenyl-6-methoxyphenol hydroxylase-like FAD-dependent oxidoreductase